MPAAWRTPQPSARRRARARRPRRAARRLAEPVPRVLAQADGGVLDRAEAGKCSPAGGVVRQRVQRVVGRERVDDVAHRVRGGQAGVVALDVDGVEVARQLDLGGEVAQHVALRAALELEDAHLGLAVGRRRGSIVQLPR